ncbi:MAG: glycoside hydrolase family 31 protein, partial [Spirochaetaceae bacterium]|nr:glycoside hydrolase family 31 protein [Spirochaetaceae bacterium]
MRRTKELFMRWAELAAFTPMMRTHEGNRPRDNWQFDSDDETLDHLARMARLFVSLGDYRKEAIARNAREGIPAMRPMFLAFEDDRESWSIKDQFMLGDDLLVAPVIREGANSRAVRLPPGRWIHAWSGAEAGGSGPGRGIDAGRGIDVPALLGEPPAFARADSPWTERLLAAFKAV